MKIIGYSQPIAWKQPQHNLQMVEEKFSALQADLFVVPEMFTTGFCMEADEVADRAEETLAWMKSFAQKKKAAIAGSVATKEGEDHYNRMYFVKPDGSYDQYDKRHLFSYSGEDQSYVRGERRVVTEYLGVRFLLQVCYDARFPVFARNIGDYEVLLNVANWPDTRIAAWHILQQARAIENQAYVFALNRTGTDGNGLYYPESSHCFFADGTEVSTKAEDLVFAELDLELLRNYRKKFPFLKEADPFSLD